MNTEVTYTGNGNSNYRIWFFAGGETRDDKFNVFTGSFIKLMQNIAGDDFDYVKGIFFRSTIRNVFWALNNAQRPCTNYSKSRIFSNALDQLVNHNSGHDTRLILIASSTGSVVAAQTACLLAMLNKDKHLFNKPFHLVLGASMVSTGSDLYKKLLEYQEEGLIGSIIHDEIQDQGDNTTGVGGSTRTEAYRNAFGIMFPVISFRYKTPSFLNADPETGHIHRKRSKSLRKALDYIEIVLIKHELAGSYYKERAKTELSRINELT